MLQPADIRGTVNRSAGIRTFLRANGPSTVKEVCLGLGITDNYTGAVVRASIRSMTLDGILARHEEFNPAKFSVLREPVPRPTTPAQERRAETYRNKAASAYKNAEAAYKAWLQRFASHPQTISERIREAVKQAGTATANDIYRALSLEPSIGSVRVYSIIHGLVRDGMLARDTGKPFRYRWLRDANASLRPKRVPTQKAANKQALLLQRAQAREIARRERDRVRTEKEAARKAAAEDRQLRRQQEALLRAQNKAKRAAPHTTKLAAAAEARSAKQPSRPTVRACVAETVDEWMARTGKTPEVIPTRFDEPRISVPGRRPELY